MTERADRIRTKRQAFATPGGPLDRMVRLLSVALPALVGAVAATMLIAPLSPRGEISFLLDRNKVATADDRLRVDNAMYRGLDDGGRPFSLSSGQAVQRSASVPVVQLSNLTARLNLPDGPAVLSAKAGRYGIDTEEVAVDGMLQFAAADGYRVQARNVSVSLPNQTLQGDGRVEGAIPAGTFQADRMRASLAERTVTLEGNARMRMIPGKLQMP
ncbi:LPS export ABC transporter periplasmic protein LptC [Altererythrobacter xixiisoli]|uniref:LPS export ABC transporter periplasmic protein LptC n=1 Tax=Croceibacterium xixiisoli TaxID=1476466 RepID=A0A6I4TRS9_9SPHN|nr:LPS export ABC transporter periplasmic protein LptC [Croceibacterium xixiisoli]MXO97627.1 LPS export ABC transporter periplasmic protein LptC [Croceibacterium xixiisoli]